VQRHYYYHYTHVCKYLKCAKSWSEKGGGKLGGGLLPTDPGSERCLAREMCKLHKFLAVKLRAGINKQLAN